jgi:hypothetical protein
LLEINNHSMAPIRHKTVAAPNNPPSNKNWVFGDLLAHLQEEHTAFTAAKETAHA